MPMMTSPAMWTKFVGALVLTLFFLAGCDAPPKLSPLPNDAVVLAFGDSLTFGTGANSEQSYPSVLSLLIDRPVINAGIPGEETSQGLKRLPVVLDEHQPSLLILCHGGNDIIRKRNRQQTVKNLGAMIKMAQQRNIEVVLVGVPAYGLFLSTAEFYGEVAEEFNLPFEGEALSGILTDNSLKSDMIHPNSKGYNAFAETIADVLRQEGAID